MPEGTPPGGNAPSDDELFSRLESRFHGLINSALASREKGFEKKRTEDRQALEASFAKLLDEKLTTAKPEPEPEPKGGRGKEKESPETATLRKQLEELKNRADEADRRNQVLREASRTTAIRDQVARILNASGISGNYFEAAYATLIHSGKIRPSEDIDSDEAFFVDPSGEMGLEVGLGSWLKSEQAKIFLPATGARGSGSRPTGGLPNGQKPTAEQVRGNLAARLEQELGR